MADKGKKKRPTIYDLAELAGVSPGTVSRVLNNRDKVHQKTRDRVLELAREIGIKPQASARSKQIAVVTNPERAARFRGYTNTLTSHLALSLSAKGVGMLMPPDPLTELKSLFVDGVIAVIHEGPYGEMLAELENEVPVVYIDKFDARPGQNVVSSDHYASGYLAAKHFVDAGLTRLALIGGDKVAFQKRLEGYAAAIEEAGLPVERGLTTLMGKGETLYTAVSRVVRNGAEGLFVPGASMQVIEALHVLSNVMGREVPNDISLIGGENVGVSMFQQPPLTTIREPLGEMAAAAVDMVLALADGQSVEAAQITLPVELIERDSVQLPLIPGREG